MSGRQVLGTSMNASEIAGTVAVVASVLGLMAYFAWFWHPGLSNCDAAIAKTLKAPSTYKRISADGSGGSYDIEYDAHNSLGVPLRGRGHCSVTGSDASWYETAEASSSSVDPSDLSDFIETLPDAPAPAEVVAATAKDAAAAEVRDAAEEEVTKADLADPENNLTDEQGNPADAPRGEMP